MIRQLTAWRRGAGHAAAALFAVLASVATGHAQEPDPVDPAVVAAARALAVEGVKLAQDDKCEQATPKLERAEQLHHGPIVLAQLAECYVKLGRVVEGAEAMRSVLRTPPPENASEAMKRAYASARSLLEATKDKIAMLTITVDLPSGVAVRVSVDGKEIPEALIGAARPTDPGEHEVEATAPGYLAARREVKLGPGEAQSVALSLTADPAAQRAAKAPTPEAAAVATSSDPSQEASEPAVQPRVGPSKPSSFKRRLPAYIAWTAGAAGLGVGIGFGLVAMNQESALDEACPNDVCPRPQRAKLDAAKTNGLVSTIGLAAGLAGAVLGTVLFITASDTESGPARISAGLHPTGADLTVRF